MAASTSPRSLRRQAHDLLRHAKRVWHYRKDELEEAKKERLQESLSRLKRYSRDKSAEPREVESYLRETDTFLRSIGKNYYPRSGLVENIEMLLVAAIVAIGIRTYIIQPFQIPTNSMYPTYNGMTYQVYEEGEQPGLLEKGFYLLDRAAGYRELIAPVNGSLKIPVRIMQFGNHEVPVLRHEWVPSRRMLILPTQAMEYTLMIGNTPVPVTVPMDFDFQGVLTEALFDAQGVSLVQALRESGHIDSSQIERIGNQYWLNTHIPFKTGEAIMRFSIFAGDALFVDRFSYHFVRPQVGDPIVFRTGKVAGLQDSAESDKYYIKRMAGGPGDQLEICDGQLWRNGQVENEASPAFRDNNQAAETGKAFKKYRGYTNRGILAQGNVYSVPADHVIGLGDNSNNSSDSRDFGAIPRDQVIGRALFRYYPFSRWGFPD